MAAAENYYNPENDRSAAEVTYYLTEGQSGRKGISENYRYSSLSEDAGLSMTFHIRVRILRQITG